MKSTKELARKLGLLRKRSTTTQQDRDVRKAGKTCQIFAYLIVIDFESTCWKDKKNVGQEIIEFPAVLLNTASGEVESEFHTYVLPEENPILSDFCTELTGIKQAKVETGAPLSVCLSQFSRWLKRLEAEKCIAYNSKQDEFRKLCTFVTWSDWDLAVCLHYECKRKQLVKPPALISWIDLRATYKNFYQRKPQGLHGALQDVGIEFSGRQHSGLDDSRNTARLAWRMMCDGCIMKITRTIQGNGQKCIAPTRHKFPKPTQRHAVKITSPLLSYMTTTDTDQELKTKTMPQCTNIRNVEVYKLEIQSQLCGHEDLQQIPVATQDQLQNLPCENDDLRVIPEGTHTETIQGHQYCNEGLFSVECRTDEFMTSTQAITWRDKWGNSVSTCTSGNNSVPTSNVISPNVVLGAGNPCLTLEGFSRNDFSAKSIMSIQTCLGTITGLKHTDGRNPVKQASPMQGVKNSLIKIQMGEKSVSSVQVSGVGSKQSPPMWTSYQRKSSACTRGSFKTPTGAAPIARKSPQSSIVLRAPTGMPKLSPEMLGGKITPPMCGCGRRTKKNNVASPGPNQGRTFYSCPNRKNIGRSSEAALKDSTNRMKQGCGYFKWESVVLREKLVMTGTPVNYKRTPVSNASMRYGHTQNTVGKLGLSEFSVGTGNQQVHFGNRFKEGAKRLGTRPRTFLKQTSMTFKLGSC